MKLTKEIKTAILNEIYYHESGVDIAHCRHWLPRRGEPLCSIGINNGNCNMCPYRIITGMTCIELWMDASPAGINFYDTDEEVRLMLAYMLADACGMKVKGMFR
jgi:hypothetical protein